MGDRGRLVIPAELHARQHWDQGTSLLLIESPHAVLLATQEQAKQLIRQQLAGASLVDELVAKRRAEAAQDDA